MVEQETHDPALAPLNCRPQLDPLGAPLIQLSAPLAQALGRMRHRVRSDLRSIRVHHPYRMRLIRPVHSKVVAHSFPPLGSSPTRPRSRNGEVSHIPALRGATFS